MNHRITDVAFAGKETGDWRRPYVCEHCGEAIGMHYQYADGRIVCVEVTNDVPSSDTSTASQEPK